MFSFGVVETARDYYFCRSCGKGFGKSDNTLCIDKTEHKMTEKTVEVITYMAQLVPSFERASESLKKLIKMEVSTTQIQKVSEEVGKNLFEQDMNVAQNMYTEPEKYFENKLPKDKKEGRLYIMVDGSAVNTRVEDDGSTWKEMKLGLVFCDKDMIKRENGSNIITKKDYVAYFGSIEEFKKMIFSCAIENGYGSIKEVVIVGDGAKWIWKMCDEVFPDAVKILDFFHMTENVYAYGNYLYHNDIKSRDSWVNTVIHEIKQGKVLKVIDKVSRLDNTNLPAGVPNLAQYLSNNKERVNYDCLKESGYIIGSGAIESANKMVIHQRLKQSGMRWSINGAQYIAALRTKHESNKWEEVESAIFSQVI